MGPGEKKSHPLCEQVISPLMKCAVQFSHLLSVWAGRCVPFLQKENMLTVTSAGVAQTKGITMSVTARLCLWHKLGVGAFFCFILGGWGDLPCASNACLFKFSHALRQGRALGIF